MIIHSSSLTLATTKPLPGGYALVVLPPGSDVPPEISERAILPHEAPPALRELAELPAVIPPGYPLADVLIRAYEAWIKDTCSDVATAQRVLDELRLEAQPDEWMSLTAAARQLAARWGVGQHNALLRLRRAIERGQVRVVRDPRVRNPQRARRVARADVDGLT